MHYIECNICFHNRTKSVLLTAAVGKDESARGDLVCAQPQNISARALFQLSSLLKTLWHSMAAQSVLLSPSPTSGPRMCPRAGNSAELERLLISHLVLSMQSCGQCLESRGEGDILC